MANLFVACARPPGDAKSEANEPWTIEADIKEAPGLIARAKLTCADESECPESVALMIAVTEKKNDRVSFQQCTSFLVADDIIATNTHCVPQKLRQPGAKCSGQIAFVFPTKGGAAVRAECAEVLSTTKIDQNPRSTDYLRKVDVAFMRLSAKVPNVTPLKFDRRGLPDGLRLRALVIDPVKQGQIEGSLATRDCSTVQATVANPSYVSDTAGVATATGCEIRTGNSGAPALDDDGSVRALVFGVLPTNATSPELAGYDTPSRYEAISYLSNAACIDIPPGVSASGTRESEKNCDRRSSIEDLRERARKNAGLDFESVFETWKSTAPSTFGYKLLELKAAGPDNAYTRTSLPTLACIKDPATWPSLKIMAQKFEHFERTSSTVSATLKLPVWAGTFSLDELYRISVRAKAVDRAHLDVRIDLADLASGPAKTQIAVKSDKGLILSKSTTANLKKCSGEE
ncbi:MAG: trypsin-like peptidase domain-containing protein [Bdellovibrionota bacterium]